MNVTKLHNLTKQNSYIGQITAARCNLVMLINNYHQI